MKKIFYIVLLSTLFYGKSLYLSNIPLPQTYIINLETKDCDISCLENYKKSDDIFYFISNFKANNANDDLSYYYETLKSKLNLKTKNIKKEIKIALLIPKNVIGRYSISTTNSVLAYLLYKKVNFHLELFNSQDESIQNLQRTVTKINEKGFKFVIAPLTETGAKKLTSIKSNLFFYIPTVNKNDIKTDLSNYYFGGINYNKQIEKLMFFTNSKIAVFSDKSAIGYKLLSYIKKHNKKIVYQKVIPQKLSKFRSLLRHNRRLNKSSIFLNTPIVKTSLLASQLRFYRIRPYALFSIQNSYNPLLLSLTQYGDRKKFYISSSIGEINDNLRVVNKILDNDIVFDWINYSTSIGIDYFYSFYFNSQSSKVFNENMVDNQVSYSISIVKPTRSKFEKIHSLNNLTY